MRVIDFPVEECSRYKQPVRPYPRVPAPPSVRDGVLCLLGRAFPEAPETRSIPRKQAGGEHGSQEPLGLAGGADRYS